MNHAILEMKCIQRSILVFSYYLYLKIIWQIYKIVLLYQNLFSFKIYVDLIVFDIPLPIISLDTYTNVSKEYISVYLKPYSKFSTSVNPYSFTMCFNFSASRSRVVMGGTLLSLLYIASKSTKMAFSLLGNVRKVAMCEPFSRLAYSKDFIFRYFTLFRISLANSNKYM